jgi:uncharacterized membrane protein
VLIAVGFAVAYVVGSVVGRWPVVAVVVAAVVAAGSVLFGWHPATKALAGIATPAVILGTNVPPSTGLALAGIFVAGGAWATLVALGWPSPKSTAAAPAPAPPIPGRPDRAVRVYALLYAAAAALGLMIGFAFGFEHVAWSAAAAVFIMRPQPELSLSRAVGRVVGTYAGVLLAALLGGHGLDRLAFAVVVAAIGTAIGLRTSRWYITPGFTALVVVLVAGVGRVHDFDVVFVDRLGAAIALPFGVFVPDVIARRRFAGGLRAAHP